VEENRGRVARAIGVPVRRWVLGRQVHGTAIADVGELEIGRGSMDHNSGIARTDGLVTAMEEVATGVLTADCVPLVIVDTEHRATAVIHAGWRGVLSGIPSRGAMWLADRYGGRAERLTALIGPHIRGCCMRVDEDLARTFGREFRRSRVVPGDNIDSLDLAAACLEQLTSYGLSAQNIHDTAVCTRCSQEYYSYRREPACGRQGTFAVVRGAR
jgi:YfiH family protein